MFLVGLVDDCVHLKPYAKLVGQIVFCTFVTMFGLRLHWLPSRVLDQVLTIFWLVGITNAVNLLDNLDGLAGGIAAIAALYLVYFCHAAGFGGAAFLTATFAGAVLGFLVFNVNPASIFMGDCGSLFLGFFLGGRDARFNGIGRDSPQCRRGAGDPRLAAPDPDHRHDAGDHHAADGGTTGLARAGAITPRTAWWRSAYRSAMQR